jgi:hypothetical protein
MSFRNRFRGQLLFGGGSRRMVPPNTQYRRNAMLVRLESLILAQDERWRRA